MPQKLKNPSNPIGVLPPRSPSAMDTRSTQKESQTQRSSRRPASWNPESFSSARHSSSGKHHNSHPSTSSKSKRSSIRALDNMESISSMGLSTAPTQTFYNGRTDSEYSASIYSQDATTEVLNVDGTCNLKQSGEISAIGRTEIHSHESTKTNALVDPKHSTLESKQPITFPKAKSDRRRRKAGDQFGDNSVDPPRHVYASSPTAGQTSKVKEIVRKEPQELANFANGKREPKRRSRHAPSGSDAAAGEEIRMRDLHPDRDRRRNSLLQLSRPKAEATLVTNPLVKNYSHRTYQQTDVDIRTPSSSNLPLGWGIAHDRFICYLSTHAPLTTKGRVPKNEEQCERYTYKQISRMLKERFPTLKCNTVLASSIQNRLDTLELQPNDFFRVKYGYYKDMPWGKDI